MAERGQGGVIVNVSSGGASRAHRQMFGYDTSKGGIEAATRAMALDLAPLGIRVNAIVPGSIRVERGISVGDAPIPPSDVIRWPGKGRRRISRPRSPFSARMTPLTSPERASSWMAAWTRNCAARLLITATITATTLEAWHPRARRGKPLDFNRRGIPTSASKSCTNFQSNDLQGRQPKSPESASHRGIGRPD